VKCSVNSSAPFIIILLFFFQAEDGIRDFHVTGVQTCALPISTTVISVSGDTFTLADPVPASGPDAPDVAVHARLGIETDYDAYRSEERRVGKGGRTRWCTGVCK